MVSVLDWGSRGTAGYSGQIRLSRGAKKSLNCHELRLVGYKPVSPQGWSIYGAERSQPVATDGKRTRRGKGSDRRKTLPRAANGCRETPMVSRASAVGCHPLREVPFPEKEGSTRGPLSAGFRRALTQATHYSTIMHDLLFARASTNRASLTAQAVRRPPHEWQDLLRNDDQQGSRGALC
jgi:hypothetical protein